MKSVLAIDPGFDRIGIAILDRNKLLYSECLETNRKSSHEQRLLESGKRVRKIIKKWRPEALAIEKLFFNQNITTALKVAEARGVVLYEAARAGVEVYEYSPQAVKIAVTGYGKATKREMEKMIGKLVKLNETKKLDDELDAIALGITHIATQIRI